jgi:hypothetical protein
MLATQLFIMELPQESNGVHRSLLESDVKVKIFMMLAASKLSPYETIGVHWSQS